MLTIRAFKYGQVSVFHQRSATVKESGSNFDFKRIPLGNGEYRYETEKVFAPLENCTHLEITGKSHDPNHRVYGYKEKGIYYDHSFIFSLEEYPELREWLSSIPYTESIYRDDLLSLSKDRIPLLIKRISKGYAIAERKLIEELNVPLHPYYQILLRFVEWGESLDVDPLVANA